MSENANLESAVSDALSKADVLFTHRSECAETTKGCSFYLPAFHVYIEVAEYVTERAIQRVRNTDNAILVIGPAGTATLGCLLRKGRP